MLTLYNLCLTSLWVSSWSEEIFYLLRCSKLIMTLFLCYKEFRVSNASFEMFVNTCFKSSPNNCNLNFVKTFFFSSPASRHSSPSFCDFSSVHFCSARTIFCIKETMLGTLTSLTPFLESRPAIDRANWVIGDSLAFKDSLAYNYHILCLPPSSFALYDTWML